MVIAKSSVPKLANCGDLNVTAKILIWGHLSNDAKLTFNPQYQASGPAPCPSASPSAG
jgi:hypothetical protein